MLGFAFIRERIINNNNLNSFEIYPSYDHNIDQYFIDKSMNNEQEITDFKIHYPSIVSDLVSITKLIDSENFCYKIIGNSKNHAALERNNSIQEQQSN